MAGKTLDDLAAQLQRLDGQGYGAYKSIAGSWTDEDFTLHIDRVQGDPFAAPSIVRIEVPALIHGHDRAHWEDRVRRVALCDLLLRDLAAACHQATDKVGGSGKSGLLRADAGDACILERNGASIDERSGTLWLRLRVGLPARGRRVLGRSAAMLLCELLPEAATATWAEASDPAELKAWCDLAEEHAHLQGELRERGLVAFVANGSLLPRISGASTEALPDAVPFRAPASMTVSLATKHHGEIRGMAIPTGVTLITGAGYHGKTTLLQAIQEGVYPHIPGDGREWVVTDPLALKVRSEDGRSVTDVDLRPFIDALPRNRSTERFATPDASGSTSLAAAVIEAIELGASALLMDEDTCATNLLVRDARMQRLVPAETITPLVERVRELADTAGVSTLLVLGGSGDYLDVADRVIEMRDYLPLDATERAREVAAALPSAREATAEPAVVWSQPRCPVAKTFDARRGKRDKVKARGLREIVFGTETLELDALEQLVDPSQARALGAMMRRMDRAATGQVPLKALVATAVSDAVERGLHRLDDAPELAMPRALELGAAINRLRQLQVASG